MTTSTMSVFFATLSLVCWAGTLGILVLVVAARGRPASAAAGIRDDLARNALWLGWLVAAVCTVGSLYFSEVAHFVPCELCWYQRICMYPMAIVLLVAAIRRDTGIWRYAIGPLLIGIAVAIYHSQLQAFPEQRTFCSATIPCNVRFVWEFGFVSLPFMALAGFCFIVAMVLLARTADSAADLELDVAHSSEPQPLESIPS